MHTMIKNGDGTWSVGRWGPTFTNVPGMLNSSWHQIACAPTASIAARMVNWLNGGTGTPVPDAMFADLR